MPTATTPILSSPAGVFFMARISATAGFNTLNPPSWTGYPSFMGASQMTVTDGYNTAVIKGSWLSYWGTSLSGGTVNSIQVYRGEQLIGTHDNFSMFASSVQSYLGRGDFKGLYQAIQNGNDTIFGSAGNDVLAGYSGDDAITTGGGYDQVYAGVGNDRITLTRGDAFVDGGSGFDVVHLPGRAGTYGQSKTAEGWQFWNNAEGINANLASVERVAFSDGILAFDIDGNAGIMYRLYQAAFDRVPDTEGLSYWVGRMDSGILAEAIADSFINSPEGRSVYGTPGNVSNSHFVDLLYTHTLGRDYDSDGYNYWVNRLETGQTNRKDLLAFFAESNENKARVHDAIDDGIWLI
jgi:Ca2+-binding RTX toxin-like protein